MPNIRYAYSAAGYDGVLAVFDTIERRAERSARVVERTERAQTNTVRRQSAERERIERAPATRAMVLARQVERDQIRAAKREDRERASIAQRQERDQRQAVDRQVARHRSIYRQQISAAEAAGRAQARVDENMRRLRERHFAADQRRHERAVGMARRHGEREGRERAAGMARGGGSVIAESLSTPSLIRGGMRVAGGVGRAAMGAAATGTALAIGVGTMATKDALRTQEIANRVSINSRQSGKGFVDATALRKEFESVAAATPGQTAADIGEALQGFITKTGDIKTGRKLSQTFATFASASGARVQDISSAGAELYDKFKITDEKGMQDALTAMYFQGKSGAFELESAASKFAKMGSAASVFGFDKGVKGVKTLGGLSQIAMTSTGDKDVAATAVEAMLRQLVTESDTIKQKTGVDVFTDKTRTKTNDIIPMLVDTIAGAKGDQKILHDIFKDEGKKGVAPLISRFIDAKTEATGTEKQKNEAGKAALREYLTKTIEAPGSFEEVQKDAGKAQTDTTARLTAAWEKITATVGDKLLPVVAEFAEKLADTPELIDDLKLALGTLITMLESFGIIKRKDKTSAEKRDEARAKAISLHKEIQEMDVSATMDEGTRAEFVDKKAQYEIESKKAQQFDAIAKKTAAAPMTQEEIAAKYLELGNKPTSKVEELDRKEWATFVSKQIVEGGDSQFATGTGKNIVGRSGGSETDGQREFRLNQAKFHREASGEGMAGIVEAAKALTEAAAAIKKNAGNEATTIHS